MLKLIVNIIKWLTTIAPILSILTFYSFAILTWFKLGYLPHYNHPDPKSLPSNFYYNVFDFFLRCWVYLSILWIFSTIFFYLKNMALSKSQVYIYVSGIIIIVLVLVNDPNSLFEWYID